MKKNSPKFLIGICFFLFINISHCSFFKKENKKYCIPEEEFILINSREVREINLDTASKEIYLSFQNEFENTDLIINFEIANSPITHLYLYENLEDISKDDKGYYIGFKKDITLDIKSNLIKSSELTIKKNKYYIIIKNVAGYFYKDYISIFNEKDNINLNSCKPILIKMFYSTNQFTFVFDGNQNQILNLIFNMENQNFDQIMSIYVNETNLVYQGGKTKGSIVLNELKDTKGNYKLILESQEETYKEINSYIYLETKEYNIQEIKDNENIIFYYSKTSGFNFYINIDDYELNDENSITFKFDENPKLNKQIEHIYGKVMNFQKLDENKFIANAPAKEEDNNMLYKKLYGTENIHKLYFKKDIEKEEGKQAYLLVHLGIKIEDDEFILPQRGQIFFNKPINKHELSDKDIGILYNEKISLKSYTSFTFLFKLPMINNDIKYIFYTNKRIQNIYKDTLLNIENSDNNPIEVYVLDPTKIKLQKNQTTLNLYIQLSYDTNEEIIYRIESTKSELYYINTLSKQPLSIFKQQMDCKNSFYYIGNYNFLYEKYKLYFEKLNGEYEIYYRGKIDLLSESTVLTNANEKYKLKNIYYDVSNNIDIIEFKCIYPGIFNMHIINNVVNTDIIMYSENINILQKDTVYEIKPIIDKLRRNFNIVISTLLNKEIEIINGDNKIIINKDNPEYKITYEKSSEVPNSYQILSKEEDALYSFKLTETSIYDIIENEESYETTNSNLIIKIKNDLNYKKLILEFSKIYHGFYYKISKGDIKYTVKPNLENFIFIEKNKVNQIVLEISNLYTKYQLNNDELYYMTIIVDNAEDLFYNVKINYINSDSYDKLSMGKSIIINEQIENKKYSIENINDTPINLVYQNCEKSLKKIYITNYDYIINSYDIDSSDEKTYKFINFKNYDKFIQLGLSINENNNEYNIGADIGTTNKEINQEILDYYNNKRIDIKQNKKEIYWDKISSNDKSYDIVVFLNKTNINKNINNICYLNYLINNKDKNNDIVKYHTTDNKIILNEQEKCLVIVVANVEGDIPLKYIYNELNYDPSNKSKDEDEGLDKNTKIFMGVAVPVVALISFALIYYLIKSKKQDPELLKKNLLPESNKLVRDTVSSQNA